MATNDEMTIANPDELPRTGGQRLGYRIDDEAGRLMPCEIAVAQVIVYNSPTIDDEADLLELHNIDYHTLQSSLDPDELSRLEFEGDHAALIFKRPKSFCAEDNFLLKLTSTGLFLYEDYLVVVMPDDAPLFEGRVPFRVHSIQDVILRLLYQSIYHFEGHLKAINMLSDSLERRINTSMENRYLLKRLGFDHDQTGILDDLAIESNQCLRRSEIYAQVIAGLMDARASIVSNNLNILIKKFTIWTIAIMLANLVVGIFSMNVRLPMPMENDLWPFYIINGLAVGSACFVFALSRFRKW